MQILCVIPARLGSTRLPKKPLLDLGGKPLVQRTYEAAASCKHVDKVVVATDSKDIQDVITNCGGEAVMTPEDINTGSDRVAFVAKSYPDYDVVVNLQGDEPFIKHSMLEALVTPFKDSSVKMSTIACPLKWETEYESPLNVKVIRDKNGDAIYFSRSPIPYLRVEGKPPVWKHIGLYAYTRDFLLEYTTFEQTPLEKSELLEQLRVLENGYSIRVGIVEDRTLEINEPEELEQARKLIASGDLEII